VKDGRLDPFSSAIKPTIRPPPPPPVPPIPALVPVGDAVEEPPLAEKTQPVPQLKALMEKPRTPPPPDPPIPVPEVEN
jgi:hypothetical protein